MRSTAKTSGFVKETIRVPPKVSAYFSGMGKFDPDNSSTTMKGFTMNKRMLGFLLAAIITFPVQAGLADFLNGVKVGQQLPAHNFQFIGSVPDTSDKLLLIDFWATHCAPCITSIPEVNALHDKYAAKGLVIIGLSDETEAKVKPFLVKHPMRYASAIEGTQSLKKELRIKAIPYAIFVDRTSKIVWRGQPDDITDKLIDSLLLGNAKAKAAK